MTAPRPRREWRVTWRRRSWSPSTSNHSRHMQREYDVDRFVDYLEDSGADVWVDVRDVGPWEPAP